MTKSEENWYSEDNATLGDRLHVAREAAGLGLADLAAQLGVKPESLEAWENDRREPRANRLQMLTGLLGVSLGWLLTGLGDAPDDRDADAAIADDVNAILKDIRSVRAEMAQSAVRLGHLEKRLRAALVNA